MTVTWISTSSPKGLIWEALSCAYDSLLTILHSILAENEDHWLNHLSNFNDFFSVMSEGWQNDEPGISRELLVTESDIPLSQRDPASFPTMKEKAQDVYCLDWSSVQQSNMSVKHRRVMSMLPWFVEQVNFKFTILALEARQVQLYQNSCRIHWIQRSTKDGRTCLRQLQ